jgi:hypothetical protein
LDELDLLAGLLLEGGDDLPDRGVLLLVEALVPPDDKVGGPGAERRHEDQHGGKDNSASSHHGRLPEVIAQHTPIAAALVAPIPHFRMIVSVPGAPSHPITSVAGRLGQKNARKSWAPESWSFTQIPRGEGVRVQGVKRPSGGPPGSLIRRE